MYELKINVVIVGLGTFHDILIILTTLSLTMLPITLP